MQLSNKIKMKKSKFDWPLNGLYISTDNKKKEQTFGFEFLFKKLLSGSISDYPIGDDYRILYNKKSTSGSNRFLLKYVHDTSIEGPIIFINDEKKKIFFTDIGSQSIPPPLYD
jgi:hypothetical protein